MLNSTLNGIAVIDQYVSSTPVVLHARLNDHLRWVQINKVRKKPKTVTPFPKWNKPVARSDYDIRDNAMSEKHQSNMLSCSKAPKSQQVEHWKHLKKIQWRYVGTGKNCLFRFLWKSFHSCRPTSIIPSVNTTSLQQTKRYI